MTRRTISSKADVLLVALTLSACSDVTQDDVGESSDVTPRIVSQPNFSSSTKWQYIGVVGTMEQPEIVESSTSVPGEVEDTSSSIADSPAERALHRPIVIEDGTWKAYRQIVDSPLLGFSSFGASETSTGSGAQGLYPDANEPYGLVSTRGMDGGDDACMEDDVECSVIPSTDDRTRRSNTTSYPWKATVALYGKNADGTAPGPGGCSGTLVGPRHVLTSAHCVWNRDNSKVTPVVVVPGMDGVGNEPYGKKNVKYYYVPDGYWQDDSITQSQERRYDYALLVLWDEEFSNGWFGMASKSSGNLKNSGMFCSGRPKRDQICADSPRVDSKCWRYLFVDDCSITNVYAGYFKHQCDTQDGMSGSPAYHFNGGDRQVVGVHKGFFGSNKNGATRIRDGNFETICDAIHENQTDHDHGCY